MAVMLDSSGHGVETPFYDKYMAPSHHLLVGKS